MATSVKTTSPPSPEQSGTCAQDALPHLTPSAARNGQHSIGSRAQFKTLSFGETTGILGPREEEVQVNNLRIPPFFLWE